jgi:hypothetical protein
MGHEITIFLMPIIINRFFLHMSGRIFKKIFARFLRKIRQSFSCFSEKTMRFIARTSNFIAANKMFTF